MVLFPALPTNLGNRGSRFPRISTATTFCSPCQNHQLGVQASPQARPDQSFYRAVIPGCLSTSQQDVVRSCGGHLGCGSAGEPHDCRMGRHVATDADLSLRLVPPLRRSRTYTKLSQMPVELVPKGPKLSGLPVRQILTDVRTISTEHLGWRATNCATLPSKKRWMPLRPCDLHYRLNPGRSTRLAM